MPRFDLGNVIFTEFEHSSTSVAAAICTNSSRTTTALRSHTSAFYFFGTVGVCLDPSDKVRVC